MSRELAKQRFEEKEYESAAQVYSKCISESPSDHILYSNRSLCFYNMKRFEEAETDATTCINLEPTFYKGYLRLSKALCAQKKSVQALKGLSKGLTLVKEKDFLQREINQISSMVNSVRETIASRLEKLYNKAAPEPQSCAESMVNAYLEFKKAVEIASNLKINADSITGDHGTLTWFTNAYVHDYRVISLQDKILQMLLLGCLYDMHNINVPTFESRSQLVDYLKSAEPLTLTLYCRNLIFDAIVNRHTGDPENSVSNFEQVCTILSSSNAKVSVTEPSFIRSVQCLLAECLIETKKYTEAMNVADSILESCKKYPIEPIVYESLNEDDQFNFRIRETQCFQNHLAKAFLIKGIVLANSKNYKDAAANFLNATAHLPQDDADCCIAYSRHLDCLLMENPERKNEIQEMYRESFEPLKEMALTLFPEQYFITKSHAGTDKHQI